MIGVQVLSFLISLFSFTAAVFALVYLYFLYNFTYWKRKGVPQIEPKFPLGSSNVSNTGLNMGAVTADFYKEFKKRGCRYGGIFAGPSPKLVLLDLELIKQIFTKDFAYFTGRGNYYNGKDQPIVAHLFSVEGKRWRTLRTKLTPTFTSGKMKMMFNTLVECSEYMTEALLQGKEDVFDAKDVCARFTTDVIGSVAFGIECNSFKHPDAKFRVIGMKAVRGNALVMVKRFLGLTFPEFAKTLGLTTLAKDVEVFFSSMVHDVVSTREKNYIRRNDFLQLLIDMKNSVKLEDMDQTMFDDNKYTLTMDEIIAQVFVFFIAGFDTSSSTMQFCLYELARNEKLQQKARKEVDELYEKTGGKITYEAVMELKFLSQLIDETLRKYPPLPTLTRKCEKDYLLPGTDLVVERGTLAIIPVLGLHHDEEYYPNPDEFNPERFSEENKKKIPHFAYMPFGEGPRICIGLRFGLLQTKVGMCALLRNFEFRVSPKTGVVEINKSAFLIDTIKPIYLEYSKVNRS